MRNGNARQSSVQSDLCLSSKDRRYSLAIRSVAQPSTSFRSTCERISSSASRHTTVRSRATRTLGRSGRDVSCTTCWYGLHFQASAYSGARLPSSRSLTCFPMFGKNLKPWALAPPAMTRPGCSGCSVIRKLASGVLASSYRLVKTSCKTGERLPQVTYSESQHIRS